MKKINLLKNALCLILIFSMLLTLFGCISRDSKAGDDSTVTQNITQKATQKVTYSFSKYDQKDYDKIKDYKIIEVEDGYRLVFDNSEVYELSEEPSDLLSMEYSSIKELYEQLNKGTLSFADKRQLQYIAKKDEKGIIIPDLNNLYMPILPQDCSVYDSQANVSWRGSSYRHNMALISNKYDISIGSLLYITFFTYNEYNQELKTQTYVEKYCSDSTWIHENGKDSIVYSIEGEKFQREKIRYTISNEDKTMLIIENHCHYQKRTWIENTIAFCVSNGAYFTIFLYGDFLTNNGSVDPEWLFQFDVQRYVSDQNS